MALVSAEISCSRVAVTPQQRGAVVGQTTPGGVASTPSVAEEPESLMEKKVYALRNNNTEEVEKIAFANASGWKMFLELFSLTGLFLDCVVTLRDGEKPPRFVAIQSAFDEFFDEHHQRTGPLYIHVQVIKRAEDGNGVRVLQNQIVGALVCDGDVRFRSGRIARNSPGKVELSFESADDKGVIEFELMPDDTVRCRVVEGKTAAESTRLSDEIFRGAVPDLPQ